MRTNRDKHARMCHMLEDREQVLLKVNAVVWFNKDRKFYNLRPRYIQIRINGINRTCENSKQAISFHKDNA